jgi:predicted AAA+ superfamily ATPase
MTGMAYVSRVADAELERRLRRSGAVLIEGVKGCGKTATASQVARSEVRVDTDPSVPAFMDADPARILEGPTPRLLDEWQFQPHLWNYVRRAVDDRSAKGQFILTGSATPDQEDAAAEARHPGVGRFSVMRMRPMSLWEAGHSTGEISLAALRAGDDARAEESPLTLDSIAGLVVRGGWPETLTWPDDEAREYVLDYVDLLANTDLRRALGIRHDPTRVRRLLRALARVTSTQASIATLTRDVAGAGHTLNRETATRYLAALERLMVSDDAPAWQTALRDSATLRKAPVRYLVDPSLAAAALGATEAKLVAEPKTLGLLFESLAVRDLRVYAATQRGEVYHYRDSAGREIDVVLQYPDGWIACEIKLGVGSVDKAAESLKTTVRNIDTQTVGAPDRLVVLTGLGPGYIRADGVAVVPLSALRP